MSKNIDPQKYQLVKFFLSLLQTIFSLLFLAILAFSPLREILLSTIALFSSGGFVSIALFMTILYSLETLLFFPLSFYQGYTIEHQFSLSTQTIRSWLVEELKSLLLGGFFTVVMGIILFEVVQSFGSAWWIVFGSVTFIFSILLAHLAPVLLLPLFYKITPIADATLAEKIASFCFKCGISVSGVYTFNLSKNTKKANAALTGLGKTKKIILGDTLISTCTHEEILAVLAHEIGHLKKSHILKMIFLGSIISFGSFFLVALILNTIIPLLSIPITSTLQAFPFYLFFITLLSFILTPLNNAITRTFEWEADEFAVQNSNPASFITALTKLATTNLADPHPHPLIVWWSYSHPPIQSRIDKAKLLQ